MHDQYTVAGRTQQDLAALLITAGVITAGLAIRPGMGYAYQGPAQPNLGAQPLEFGLIWWSAAAANEAEQQERDEIIATLDAAGGIYTGPAPIYGTGTPGHQQPTGVAAIRAARTHRQLNGGFPLTLNGQQVWWHSNYQSRDQQMGLMMAGVIGVLKTMLGAQWAAVTAAPMINPRTGTQQTWRMMSGQDVPLTVGTMFDLLLAAMGQEGATDAAAQAAIAAYEAGTLTDLSAIQWPASYEG